MALVWTDAGVAEQYTLQFEVIVVYCVRVIVLLYYLLGQFHIIHCCISVSGQIKVIFPVWRKSSVKKSERKHYILYHIFVLYYILFRTYWVSYSSRYLEVEQVSTVVPCVRVYLKVFSPRLKGERSILVESSKKARTARASSEPKYQRIFSFIAKWREEDISDNRSLWMNFDDQIA